MAKALLGEYTWAGSREGLVGRPIMRSMQATTSDQVFAGANPHRRAIMLSNLDGTNDIVVAINAAATSTFGIRLPIKSRPLLIEEYWWGKLPEAEWHAIALAGTAQLGIIEIED